MHLKNTVGDASGSSEDEASRHRQSPPEEAFYCRINTTLSPGEADHLGSLYVHFNIIAHR